MAPLSRQLVELLDEAEDLLRRHGQPVEAGKEGTETQQAVIVKELLAETLLSEKGEGLDNEELQWRMEHIDAERLRSAARDLGDTPAGAVAQAMRDLAGCEKPPLAVERLSRDGKRVAVAQVKDLERLCDFLPRPKLTGPPGRPWARRRKRRSPEPAHEGEEGEGGQCDLVELAQRPTARERAQQLLARPRPRGGGAATSS